MFIQNSYDRARNLVAPVTAALLAGLALSACGHKSPAIDTKDMAHVAYDGGMLSQKLRKHPWISSTQNGELKDDACFNTGAHKVTAIDPTILVLTREHTDNTWVGIPLAALEDKVTKDCQNDTGYAWAPLEHMAPAPKDALS